MPRHRTDRRRRSEVAPCSQSTVRCRCRAGSAGGRAAIYRVARCVFIQKPSCFSTDCVAFQQTITACFWTAHRYVVIQWPAAVHLELQIIGHFSIHKSSFFKGNSHILHFKLKTQAFVLKFALEAAGRDERQQERRSLDVRGGVYVPAIQEGSIKRRHVYTKRRQHLHVRLQQRDRLLCEAHQQHALK